MYNATHRLEASGRDARLKSVFTFLINSGGPYCCKTAAEYQACHKMATQEHLVGHHVMQEDGLDRYMV